MSAYVHVCMHNHSPCERFKKEKKKEKKEKRKGSTIRTYCVQKTVFYTVSKTLAFVSNLFTHDWLLKTNRQKTVQNHTEHLYEITK